MVDRQSVNTEFAKWMLDDPSPQKIEFVNRMTNTTPSSIAALLNTNYWYLDNTQEAEDLNDNVPMLYFTSQRVALQSSRPPNTPLLRLSGPTEST